MPREVKGGALLLLLFLWTICAYAQYSINPNNHFASITDINANQQQTQSFRLSEGNTEQDTAEFDYNQKAKNTAIKSALVPGLGQIQNGQIWKAPIVWAGLGFTAYLFIDNNGKYQEFSKAYRLRTDNDPNTIDPYSQQANNNKPVYSQQALKKARTTFRRRSTLSLFSILGVWSLNILDAYVFAHLQDFDVSDDLSASVNPPNFGNIARTNALMTGITLKLSP